ncbi:MAG: hypothetical protein LBT62_05380, partial [Deltaproteobacteria bacterium]|nr:hypothetical protein [Deltaproteobacteria bacterium]
FSSMIQLIALAGKRRRLSFLQNDNPRIIIPANNHSCLKRRSNAIFPPCSRRERRKRPFTNAKLSLSFG